MTVITGFILLALLGILGLYAQEDVRINNFKRFHRVNLYSSFFFIVLLVLHRAYHGRSKTCKYEITSLSAYLFDIAIRRMRIFANQLILASEHSVFIRSDILYLRVPKPFSYLPGQYVGMYSDVQLCKSRGS